MIKVRGLTKSFSAGLNVRHILDGISFDLPEGSFTTIFGPNGCGKSTLVNIIAGIDSPTAGSVSGAHKLNGSVGYVFQDYRRSLLPWHSVEQNILFPLKIRGIGRDECKASLEEILSVTGIRLDLKQRVYSLSGGQAQAACILRALIMRPQLLILDEPFAALDYERTMTLREVLSRISKALKLTVLFISHDLDEAIILGDQVVFLSRPPTTVASVLPVNLPFPRSIETSTSSEFVAIKQQAVKIFQECVRVEGCSDA